MATLKSSIKSAINQSQDKWRVHKIWPITVDEPQYMSGTHTMLIEVSVVKRKRKK
jgi:hypothetical protein